MEDIESDLLLWTAGSQPSLLLDSLEVPKDGRGRVEVNSQLQVMVSETYRGGDNEMPVPSTVEADYAADVFCMGDAATVQGMDLRSTAQVQDGVFGFILSSAPRKDAMVFKVFIIVMILRFSFFLTVSTVFMASIVSTVYDLMVFDFNDKK